MTCKLKALYRYHQTLTVPGGERDIVAPSIYAEFAKAEQFKNLPRVEWFASQVEVEISKAREQAEKKNAEGRTIQFLTAGEPKVTTLSRGALEVPKTNKIDASRQASSEAAVAHSPVSLNIWDEATCLASVV